MSVTAPGDRSLDVSYAGDLIELSFARVKHSSRGMYAQLLKQSDGAWRYYGTLRTANANTVGELTTEPENEIDTLDGVNYGSQPDGYRAPGLSPGRYLVCINLVDPSTREICGELVIA